MRREAELSSDDLIQEVHGTHKRQPGCLGPAMSVRPGGIGKAQSAKASSMVLMLFLLSHRHAAPLTPPATKHHCTNHEDKLLLLSCATNVFNCSCTRCSRLSSFPYTDAEMFPILVSTDS